VLLGTAAGPVPGRSRMMTSHLMLSNGAAYVLDCGMGVTDQYARTGIPFNALKSIFITHHHADHNIEYGPSWSSAGFKGSRSTSAPSGRRRSSR
jgi:ribonuclease BN (tRNA processing enzyme)